MVARKWISLIVFLCLAQTAAGAGTDGVSLAHFESLERVRIVGGSDAASQKPTGLGPIELSFDALGQTFDLQLEPNARLLAAIPDATKAGGAVPYRGRIKGVEASWARIVMINGMPAGMISDGENLYALEVPGDAVVDTRVPIVYRLSDAIIEPGAFSCASGGTATSGSAMFKAVVSGLDAGISQAPGAISEITVGAVGDYEFTNDKGANAEAAILTRLSIVDGIFSDQLGVQISVPPVTTYPDINDPFSDTTVPTDLLVELRNYRGGSPQQSSYGLTHLYTGRNLDGTTVGIAYTGALCQPSFGAGLSEGRGDAVFDALIAAHEIGHNFGAPHDAEAGSPCESVVGDFIMATRLNGSTQFSACSISEMQDDIARAACITALPSTDISVAFRSASATVLLGNPANVVVDVINNGTEIAQNVVVDITVPANVSLNSATSAAATCTTGAGTVSCQFGDVAGGTATTIDLANDTASVGPGAFAATVTADADDRGDNNQDSLLLTVDPAVNLVINALAAAQVNLDQSTTLTVNFDNLSTLDATNVTLSIALNAGIRANSANWSIGTCNVTSQLVDCQAGQFDSQSSATLTLNVTGVAEGSKNYTVSLASAEADSDPTDNNVQGSVRVRTPNGGGESDSGGSIGWLFLLALAGTRLLFLRRRGDQRIAASRA